MGADFKQFLFGFCAKNKVEVVYTDEEEETGFYCEVKLNIVSNIAHSCRCCKAPCIAVSKCTPSPIH